jgi:DNA replication and repair protein RecF
MTGSGAARATVEPPPAGAGVAVPAVVRLTLTDFRNYERFRLDVAADPVVLTGANGAGKTNLLEALSLLAPGRGLRGARLFDMARRLPADAAEQPERPWAVAARVSARTGSVDAGSVEVGTGLDAGATGRERRIVRIDGETQRSQAALSACAAVNWLTPAMDRLFQDAASQRRRFLDRLVFALDPAHAGRVSSYEHAMRERARILRDGPADDAWLDTLEDTMAARGVAVAEARRTLAADLDAVAAAATGAFPRVRIKVTGTLEGWLAEGPALEAEDRLRAALRSARARDGELGGAGEGPHRSDLAVVHVEKGMAAEQCSTGEQKALLIAIILANARLQARAMGASPILLLDEVAAHLDEARRAALFEALVELGTQAWMTGTDEEFFAPLKGQAQFINIAQGAISPRAEP